MDQEPTKPTFRQIFDGNAHNLRPLSIGHFKPRHGRTIVQYNAMQHIPPDPNGDGQGAIRAVAERVLDYIVEHLGQHQLDVVAHVRAQVPPCHFCIDRIERHTHLLQIADKCKMQISRAITRNSRQRTKARGIVR